jgi:hypothetical protein
MVSQPALWNDFDPLSTTGVVSGTLLKLLPAMIMSSVMVFVVWRPLYARSLASKKTSLHAAVSLESCILANSLSQSRHYQ